MKRWQSAKSPDVVLADVVGVFPPIQPDTKVRITTAAMGLKLIFTTE